MCVLCSCFDVVDLLLGEDAVERRDLTVLVTSKHLTQGTGGDATGDAVDVDLLVLVLVTHRLLQLRLHTRFTADGQTGGGRQVDIYMTCSFSDLQTESVMNVDRGYGRQICSKLNK